MTEITSVGNNYAQIDTNLTWAEEDVNLWKGWTYSPKNNRYYFNDIGDESLASFWADDFLNQAYL